MNTFSSPSMGPQGPPYRASPQGAGGPLGERRTALPGATAGLLQCQGRYSIPGIPRISWDFLGFPGFLGIYFGLDFGLILGLILILI